MKSTQSEVYQIHVEATFKDGNVSNLIYGDFSTYAEASLEVTRKMEEAKHNERLAEYNLFIVQVVHKELVMSKYGMVAEYPVSWYK